MKLIVDIDDELVETAKFAVRMDMGDGYVKSIANGIPLDKIRAEIEQRKKNSGGEPNRDLAFNVCLQIIDRYKERSE